MQDLSRFEAELRSRAGERCELCGATEELRPREVGPDVESAERCALLCELCQAQIEGGEVDGKHWYCLRESIWSEVPAVQVLSYRMLKRFEGEGWAADLLGQMYMADEVQAWAEAGLRTEDAVLTYDSNNSLLSNGDSVTLIKDLEVKGAGFTAKRGTMVKNIRLIDDPENIEGRLNKMTLVLKTKFLKKVS